MWSSSTTTRKVQGSSSNRRPFSRCVPGPKSSQRMRRMGFACILGAGDDLEDTKSVQFLIFRHCCITLQKCTYKGPSGTKSSFGVGTHLCTASALQLQHFDQCRDDNKHKKTSKPTRNQQVKCPLWDLIAFARAVVHIGNALVDLLGCSAATKPGIGCFV